MNRPAALTHEEFEAAAKAFWTAACNQSKASEVWDVVNARLQALRNSEEMLAAESAFREANERLEVATRDEHQAIIALSASGQTAVIKQPTGRVTFFRRGFWERVDHFIDLSDPPAAKEPSE